MNRQASYPTDPVWWNFGEVSHSEAAKAVVEQRNGKEPDVVEVIETRDEGSDVIFKHRVTRRVVYDVVCLRNDEAEVGDE